MPKRRGQGDGGLFWSEARGRWLAVLELPRGADGRRRRRTVSGRTRGAALARLRQARGDAEQGVTVGRSLTVARLLDEWLERGLPNAAEATRANAEWAAGKAKAAVGSRRLAELTPEDLEDWLAGLARSGCSASTLRRLHGTLARALGWGQARGHVARNVARLVVPPTGPAKPRKALTVEQARMLLWAAEDDPLHALVVTALTLGLRPGEALSARWEDVDLAGGVWFVRRYLKRAWSRRGLAMPPRLVEVLTGHAAEQATVRVAAGPRWRDHGLVFCTKWGTPLLHGNVRRSLRRVAAWAGVGELTTYELRHSAASILYAAGVPAERVADMLGQQGSRTFEAVYKHLVEPVADVGRDVMGGVLG